MFDYLGHNKVTIYYAGDESRFRAIQNLGTVPSNCQIVFDTPVLDYPDGTDYPSYRLTTEKSQAEQLGGAMGNAVNGFLDGLLNGLSGD